MPAFEAVIGLEVHAQLSTRTKLFCGCETTYGAAPNTQVCATCLGLPGALPAPNGAALALAARAGFALGCTVARETRFDRKSYFYPDLPKGYQITQLALPLNEGGGLEVEFVEGARRIRLARIHVEEDAAKSTHEGSAGATLVDFNRAGVPLVEIVSEPDLRSPAEAEAYLRQLRDVLLFAGVSDGSLEEGSFRCDANVSLRPVGTEPLGTRVELKNINSFRFVRDALAYEIRRQEALLGRGGRVEQETRSWDPERGESAPMRGKEDAEDYRYFPDPDLPPLALGEAWCAARRAELPELPVALRARLVAELGLTEADAGVLGAHPALARYLEAAARSLAAASGISLATAGKKTANVVQAEVLRDVQLRGHEARFPVPAEALAALLALVEAGTINGKIVKSVLPRMRDEGLDAETIVAREGLAQVSDRGAIDALVAEVIAAHPAQLAQYRSGKKAVFGFFIGQVMKRSGGTANPGAVKDALHATLDAE
ncbi:MAG: Asp-tRNA(Asn)/Glu-tRNA(Gln) amidotransferase subunit GatB [Myxococcota bacterium]